MSAAKGTAKPRRFNPDRDVEDWHGAYVPYDILKEALVALLVVGVLIAGLSIIFSSPDEHPVTLKSWTANDPVDFARRRSPNSTAQVPSPRMDPHTTPRPAAPSRSASSRPRSGSGCAIP